MLKKIKLIAGGVLGLAGVYAMWRALKDSHVSPEAVATAAAAAGVIAGVFIAEEGCDEELRLKSQRKHERFEDERADTNRKVEARHQDALNAKAASGRLSAERHAKKLVDIEESRKNWESVQQRRHEREESKRILETASAYKDAEVAKVRSVERERQKDRDNAIEIATIAAEAFQPRKDARRYVPGTKYPRGHRVDYHGETYEAKWDIEGEDFDPWDWRRV